MLPTGVLSCACYPFKVMIDDFREAYWWLRDNTPEDARVMAWWDYGYQISGIANRTTIADGNTWNHEHIALLGKCLVSPLPEAHGIAKHLADYVLVWSTRFGGMQVRPTTLWFGFFLLPVGGLSVPSRDILRPRTAPTSHPRAACVLRCRATTRPKARTWRASAARSTRTSGPATSSCPRPGPRP